jgi:hypothetical protein
MGIVKWVFMLGISNTCRERKSNTLMLDIARTFARMFLYMIQYDNNCRLDRDTKNA